MLFTNLEDQKPIAVLDVKCDVCGSTFLRKRDAIEYSRQNHLGKDLCRSCSATATNKKRDRSYQLKMSKASAEHSRGKSIEERLGPEKGAIFKQRCSDRNKGEKNPNFGGVLSKGFKDRPPTGKWEDRYGIEKAKAMKENLSLKTSGHLNPMFGVSPSVKCGRGIKGWVDGIFFFSSYELRFILECIAKGKNIKALTYTNDYRVQYYLDGRRRTYTPDFLVDDKIIEIKPHRFKTFPKNLLKFEAAKEIFGESFQIITEHDLVDLPSKTQLLEMIDSKRLKFVKNDFERLTKNLK